MEQRTCNIIMCCKGHCRLEGATGEPFGDIAAYMSQECGGEKEIYQIGFAADELFAEFVEQILARRVYDTNVTAGREDRIVTLSTCSANGKRFVVHGKWKHN